LVVVLLLEFGNHLLWLLPYMQLLKKCLTRGIFGSQIMNRLCVDGIMTNSWYDQFCLCHKSIMVGVSSTLFTIAWIYV
jgi:hypothetical protein